MILLLKEKYDVIVIGGGVAGSIAAIASARAGAKTLVVERYGFMGGMLTMAGVGPMMTFHAGDTQVVKGIPDEIIETLKALGASPGHIKDTIGYASSLTPFDAEAMKYVLEHKHIEAGGEMLYHSFFTDCKVEDHNLKSVQFWTKSGLIELEADVFVDATGDADLSVKAGVPYEYGRKLDGLAQPMTMKARIGNVDIAKVRKYMKDNPEDFFTKDWSYFDETPKVSVSGFYSKLKEAREKGDLTYPRETVLFFENNNPGEVILNMSRIIKLNATDSYELTKGEIQGREQIRQSVDFLKKYIPGFELCYLVSTGPQIGVRETRRIEGVYTLMAEEMMNNVMFHDAIAMGGYPFDIHSPDGSSNNDKFLRPGTYYSIPYRIMVNNEVDNLITTGRCVSAAHEAASSLRVTPIAMALGHAAGAAAALASKSNKAARDVDVQELRRILLSQNAFLTPFNK